MRKNRQVHRNFCNSHGTNAVTMSQSTSVSLIETPKQQSKNLMLKLDRYIALNYIYIYIIKDLQTGFFFFLFKFIIPKQLHKVKSNFRLH